MTNQCRLRFSIASKLIDEVDLDVVPLDIYGIVLGSPYLYDRKVVFFCHENKYHLTKNGVEYILRTHNMKGSSLLFTIGLMKRVVNSNKLHVLAAMKTKDPCDNDEVLEK